MTCPNCGGALFHATREGIRVDECQHCGGTWFDRDELRQAKDTADDDLRWLDFDVFTDHESFAASPGERSCPKCSSPMETLTYMQSNVVVDACPSEHGVWLDEGEFDRIVERLEKLVLRMNVGEYRRRAMDELREVVTGPEGRLSELRDFLTVVRLLHYRLGAERPGAASAVSELSRRL